MAEKALPAIETILDLCRAILDNGDGLLEEARILKDHGKSARTYALGVLALEEFSKLPMLNRYAIGEFLEQPLGRLGWSSVKERMLSHDRKLRMNAWLERSVPLAEIDEESYRILRKRSESLHRRKLEAIYVDIRGTSVLSPLVEISASEAEEMLRLADQFRAFHHKIMDTAFSVLSGPPTAEARRSLSELLAQAEDEGLLFRPPGSV